MRWREDRAARLTALDGRLLEEVLHLVEKQAGAAIPAGDRDFTGYIANVLFDDWDEFGLGSRALDLVVLALDSQQLGHQAAADRLLDRAARVAGRAGLRCLVSYRALAGLAEDTREGQSPQAQLQAISAILDRLQAAGP